jgi:hypothetical protein
VLVDLLALVLFQLAVGLAFFDLVTLHVLRYSSARMTERYAHFAPTFRPPRAIEWTNGLAGMRTESR